MARRAAAQPQTSIYEKEIEDSELEEMLERRQTLRDNASLAQGEYRKVNEATKEKLDKLDLGLDAPVRIGRFVVSQRQVAARSVQFETGPTSRLVIQTLEEAA